MKNKVCIHTIPAGYKIGASHINHESFNSNTVFTMHLARFELSLPAVQGNTASFPYKSTEVPKWLQRPGNIHALKERRNQLAFNHTVHCSSDSAIYGTNNLHSSYLLRGQRRRRPLSSQNISRVLRVCFRCQWNILNYNTHLFVENCSYWR